MPNPAAKMAALPEAIGQVHNNPAPKQQQDHATWFRDAGNAEPHDAVLGRRVVAIAEKCS